MRVMFQTAVSVVVSTMAFLISPMFFPFFLIVAFCVVFAPAAIAASRQRSPASRVLDEAARQEPAPVSADADAAPSTTAPLPARA